MNLLFRVLVLSVCLVASSFAGPRFLTITDIHYGSQNASTDGNDTGDGLLNVSMTKFSELSKNVDFIITLGDIPSHSVSSSAREGYEKTVFHDLFTEDTQNKPMFYVSGNNDSLVGNYQPFEMDGKSPLNFADDWTGACTHCDGLMIDDTNMQTGGYYSSYVIPGNQDIILIALNATQWTKTPKYASKYPNQDFDANAQLQWLNTQLKNNTAKQLIIAMHEPPGLDMNGNPVWVDSYLKEFLSILEQNQNAYQQITLLTSHTHMDDIRKIQLKSGKNIYAFATPAISRVHKNNSGMKVFELDNTMALQNFTTFYTASTQQWNNDQYQALGSPKAIFPSCTGKTLTGCLDSMTDMEVASAVQSGYFYGAKSRRVNNTAISTVYRVN